MVRKSLKTRLQCSKCGAFSRYTENSSYGAKALAKAGWNSFGAACYCPKCSKTWHKRNTNDMNNKIGNIETIMDHMLQNLESSAAWYQEENEELKRKYKDYLI